MAIYVQCCPRRSMCNEEMPVSVKVYFGHPTASAVEIRRFVFRPEQHKTRSGANLGVYQALVERIRSVFNGLNLHDLHLCWKDDDGDYVVFSSDDELRVAISNTNDNTLRIYIRAKELPTRLTPRTEESNEAETGGYARISRKGDQTTAGSTARRHHRRPTRSASASRDSEISSPAAGRRRPTLSKDHLDRMHEEEQQHHHDSDDPPLINGHRRTNGVSSYSEFTSTNNHQQAADSGTSTSSGVVEESSDTMKESSNESRVDILIAGVCCTECRGQGRRGILYQCTVCPDFFLCSECENRGLHDEHIMLRIKTTLVDGQEQEAPTLNR